MVTLTFDPKINRVLPLPQGNHVAKYGKDPLYRTKVIVRKHYKYNFWQQGRFHMITLVLYFGSLPNLTTWFPCVRGRTLSKILFIVSDLDLWPNDPKINRILPLPQGNHVVKFGKDPIYKTKVIWKHPCCQKFCILDLYQTWPHDSPV
jgi:hypothetical protein